jgi:hypothetical protein
MARYVSMVLTNPVPGREDTFNGWYTNSHIPDVLSIQGIVAATRYRLHSQRGSAHEFGNFQYLAIYEIETDDLRGLFRTLLSRMGTALMPMSESMAAERAFYDWEVLGPLLVAAPASDPAFPQVRRQALCHLPKEPL